RAARTDESTSTVIRSALRTYPLSAAGQLPKNESLMLMIQRQRTTETVDADGRLPEKLRKTYRDEGFILHEDKKLIIFTKKINLSILKQNKHWFANGTFKACPDDYYQLFILHAMMTDAITPLVYGLLIGKSAEDYNLFFEKVLKQDNFQPESIVTDFETGTIRSVKDMLPNILHKGCLFHFSQAVWRQVQTGRKKPQFDHKLWNIHDRVVATVPRPNNSVECWHNAFADRVAISHPTIVKPGEKIRCEQSKFEVALTKILQSHDIKTKKACYRKLNERITRLANSFDPTQLDQFKKKAANIAI
ncbi:unnamed protein product, partial [Rotaria magnacalcarata]